MWHDGAEFAKHTRMNWRTRKQTSQTFVKSDWAVCTHCTENKENAKRTEQKRLHLCKKWAIGDVKCLGLHTVVLAIRNNCAEFENKNTRRNQWNDKRTSHTFLESQWNAMQKSVSFHVGCTQMYVKKRSGWEKHRQPRNVCETCVKCDANTHELVQFCGNAQRNLE